MTIKEQIIELLEKSGYLGMAKFEEAEKCLQCIKADLKDKPAGNYKYYIGNFEVTIAKPNTLCNL